MKTSSKGKKVLIVEDEEDILQALVDEVGRAGFRVFQAKNGKEGLEAAAKEKPDMILLDIVMPEMDGMTMMKKMREYDWGKDIPVILLTNLSVNEKILEDMVQTEPLYYLVKSDWEIRKVVGKVKERLL